MTTTPTLDPLDVAIRHQIYVEGYKNGEADKADDTTDELTAILLLLFLQNGKDNLGDLTKRELNSILAKFTTKYKQLTTNQVKAITARMRAFFDADFRLTKYIYAKLSGKTYSGPNAARLWASAKNSPAPGIGVEPKNIMVNYFSSVYRSTVKTIKQGYAEKWTVAQTVKAITGTKANKFKDGLIRKFRNQFVTAVQTYIQSLSSFLKHAIGKTFYEKYQWVSVLDSRTTDICRSRDGNIYGYGDGPIPPAHYNCRSTIVPVTVETGHEMPTWFSWFSKQPLVVQNDIVGARRGAAFRRGDYSADTMPTFDGTRSLTLTQFKDKSNQILTPTLTDN